MIDRQLIGDVALAVLLAWPTVALSRPQAPVPERPATTVIGQPALAELAELSPAERRFSLEG